MKGKDTNAYGILNDDDCKITKIAKEKKHAPFECMFLFFYINTY